MIAGAGPNELLRQYDYDDETGLGRLTEMKVFSGGQLIAGSRVTWNGLLRASEQHLALSVASGSRHGRMMIARQRPVNSNTKIAQTRSCRPLQTRAQMGIAGWEFRAVLEHQPSTVIARFDLPARRGKR
ncbi:MAG TPA: hypothetical protein VNL91_02805 [Thermoanaerobaculia bacterium]|nr:hypothetical protein [Thermoanaerobaculia bacterium]